MNDFGISLDVVPPPKPSVETRASEFTADAGAEQYNGNTLLVSAYIAIWVLILAWILVLWRKQAALGKRLDGLEAALDRAAAKTEASKA